ncbi:MAG: pyridoxamine 5'-phosphate oxidase family protein [bacterium]
MIFVFFRKSMIILFALFFLASLLIAQNENNSVRTEVSRDSLIKVARSIIDSARCRVLVTVDEFGKPHAREMDPFIPDENMIIWLGTNPKTRKVKQIENNPNVVVFYYETKGLSYVAVEGKATIVKDPDQKAKHWKNYWKRYYPDRDKDFVLIQVIPDNLELVSYKHNLFWNTDSFLPNSVKFDNAGIK